MATEEDRFGLIQLYPQPGSSHNTSLDIVAVHGLGGHPLQTWTEGKNLWLRDFLPTSIPEGRVFTYGYDSGIAFSKSMSTIDDYARDIIERLRSARRKETANRPIIFVCHSLGGIVVKKAMVIAHERGDRYGDILKAIKGILFMGTPHRGAEIAYWGAILGKLANIPLIGSMKINLLDDLQPKSKTLGEICSQFVERGKQIQIFTYFERIKTSGVNSLIVDKDSAILHLPNEVPIPMDADHRGICKFLSASSPRFRLVLDHILELIEGYGNEDDSVSREHAFNSLYTFDFTTGRDQLPDPHPGTCKWVLDNAIFQRHSRANSANVLWISGPAGSGKSVLMKYITANFNASSLTGINTVLFIFCGRVSGDTDSKAILKSILLQILEQNHHFFRYLNDNFLTESKQTHGLATETVVDCINAILAHARNQRFWIAIDALDEIPVSEAKSLVQNITDMINQDSMGRLKVFITDRREPAQAVRSALLSRLSNIDLEIDLVHKDVGLYVSKIVRDFGFDHRIPTALCDKVCSTITTRANGLFLLASVMWNAFLQGVSRWTPRVIDHKLLMLENVPAEVESLYCTILQNVPADFQPILRKIFAWLLVAREPLTVIDLDSAISVTEQHKSYQELRKDLSFDFEQVIREYGGSFLKIGPNGEVKFRHQTVKELLSGSSHRPDSEEILLKYRQSTVACEYLVASSCLAILMFEDLSDEINNLMPASIYEDQDIHWILSNGNQKIADPAALLVYTAKHWPHHLEILQDKSLTIRTVEFLMSPNFRLYRTLRAPWTTTERKISVNATPRFFPVLPLLHATLQMGDFPDVLSTLLANEREMVNTLDRECLSPLHWAILRKRKKSFILLSLNPKINPNAGIEGGDRPIHTILNKLCLELEFFKTLLAIPTVDVNCKGLEGKTALHIIVEDEESYPGFLEVLLQQKTLDFESLDDKGHTPLISALTSSKGRKGASRLLQLLPGVVNITATDRNGTNALALASFRGWTEARRELRARDKSQVYAFGLDGMNVLTRAAYFGQRRLLEDHLQEASSEDVRRFANAGRFNLANLCARQDWEDLVDNLRNRYGIESQEQDDNGRTVLHLAALNGWSYGCFSYSEKQKALLNVQDFDGRTPLHLAAASRNFASAEFLLREGASILIKDKEGKTAVHTAAEAGSRAILEHFLDSKVLEFGRDNAGRGLLHFISMWEWPPLLQKYCRTRKVLINIKDRKHQTALHIAAIFGNTQIVDLLLDYGADQTKQDHIGFTPLYHAIQQGHQQVKDLLLAKGADSGLLDGFRRSALSIAPSAKNHTQATSLSGQRIEAHPSTEIKSSGSLAIPRNYPNALLTYVHRRDLRSSVRKDLFDDMAAKLSIKAKMVLPADIDRVGPCGWTLLHKVVAFCSPEIVDVVLSAGSDPNKPNTFTGVTALHIAAYGNIYRGKLEEFQQKIRRLLDAGASIDVMDSTSCTPVEAACVRKNFEAFELLLSRGADPNIQDANGKSLLHRVVERQQVKAVKMLMGRADIHQKDHHGKTPLMAAFPADKPNRRLLEYQENSRKAVIISTLLSHGADPMVEDSEGVNVLIPATMFVRGHSVVKALTAAFARPTSNQLSRRGLSLLIQNWQMGYDDISSRFLLAGGQPMDPSASLCCYSGDRRILKALLEWKPNLSREYIVRSVDRPVTPLHYAARWLATEHVRLLLQHGADVNQLNSFEETPLMHAADSTFNPKERKRVVRLLLESGADVSIIASAGYRKGWTAVEFSANRGNQSVSKVLRGALHGVHSKPHLEAVNSVPSGKAFVQDELEYGYYFQDAENYLWDYKGLRLTSCSNF